MTAARRRRVAGEGSVFQLPNGKWRALVDLGYIDGKRRRKAVTRDTHRECAAWLAEVKSAHQAKALPARTPTVAQWFETYLSEIAPGKVRASTMSNYRRDFDRHIRPALGRIKLDALRLATRLAISGSLNQTGRLPRSVNALVSRGGAEGIRTPDPHTASVVRYQLRHGPAARTRRALAQ